jgi:uncharacterized membrane protein YsdA (DUF1294 family)
LVWRRHPIGRSTRQSTFAPCASKEPSPAALGAGAYGLASILTFFAYAFDKSAAQSGSWRTSEGTLHLMALLCGWPGALLAQQLLRHKSAKTEFRAAFWMTVVMNMAALIALASPQLRAAMA